MKAKIFVKIKKNPGANGAGISNNELFP